MSSYGADYANDNFDRSRSKYTNFVHTTKNIQNANCSIHIYHYMSTFACDTLETDIDAQILKLCYHFVYSVKQCAKYSEAYDIIRNSMIQQGSLTLLLN